MIELVGVRKAYADGREVHRVLDAVDLTVHEGEFLAILGASGSGKSTLLHLIGGLDGDFEGELNVAGCSPRGLADSALSRFRSRTVGFVFQGFNLVPELTALENVSLPAWFDDSAARDKEAERARAIEVLEEVGLAGKHHRRPDHLSGGERQRVAIARALFSGPRILLCDEPTGNLDAVTGGEIIELFQRLNGDGMTLLMVTHEARVAKAAGRVVFLSGGVLREVREPSDARPSEDPYVTDEALR